jgi:hypothetical protein
MISLDHWQRKSPISLLFSVRLVLKAINSLFDTNKNDFTLN